MNIMPTLSTKRKPTVPLFEKEGLGEILLNKSTSAIAPASMQSLILFFKGVK